MSVCLSGRRVYEDLGGSEWSAACELPIVAIDRSPLGTPQPHQACVVSWQKSPAGRLPNRDRTFLFCMSSRTR
jgi:hypothetical protein